MSRGIEDLPEDTMLAFGRAKRDMFIVDGSTHELFTEGDTLSLARLNEIMLVLSVGYGMDQ